MGIGKRLKEARERAGLTQEELGRLVGVSGSAITNYEKETSHPREKIMYALFDALDVEPNYLFQDCVNVLKGKNITPISAKGREMQSVTESEYRLVSAYCMASEADRAIIDNIVERYLPLAAQNEKTQRPMIRAAALSGGVREIEKVYPDEVANGGLLP